MLPYDLEELTCAHIQGLIDADVPEGLRLEYKRQLPLDPPESRKKFLSRVTAMANAGGGDIVYGISERKGPDNQNTGIADSFAGMRISNAGKLIESLMNLIRNGVAPSLSGVAIKTIHSPNGDILVVRILSSWDKPHMVILEDANRFYIRTEIGVSPMRVDEIGRAFAQQREIGESIDRWRTERTAMILQDKSPAPLGPGVVVLFHMIPADAFNRGILRTAWKVPIEERREMHVACGNYNQRYNADGLVCHSQVGSQLVGVKHCGYTQLFRSGTIEFAFNCDSLVYNGVETIHFISGPIVEQRIVECYEHGLPQFRKRMGTGVIFGGLCLVRTEGKRILINRGFNCSEQINQNVFISPEILVDINEPDEKPYAKTLLPLLDTMWQTSGLEESPFRDNAGSWNPFRNNED